jgi:16S rRNA (adenine1518-N6/adenine1519-N6)-dimethyltransferase
MHRARKRFGQHFLHDQTIIQRIIDAIAPRIDEHVVEIGPGLGAITFPLLDRIGRLEAVEIDRDAARRLREVAPEHGTLQLHEADVLEFDFRTLSRTGERLRLVGNLPYNISTPLLFHLIGQREVVIDMHFMLQKEVVDRMAAGANDDDYGRLSVMLAPWLAVQRLFDIGPGAFRPPPRVVSTFVRLLPHASPPFPIGDQRKFSSVVAAAFSQRRKTLRNALKPLLSERQIELAGIDPGARAETIPPAGFAALAAQLTDPLCTTVLARDDNLP